MISDNLEMLECCPICGANDSRRIYSNLTDKLYSVSGLWNVSQCNACKVWYINPRLTKKSISTAYINYHTHNSLSTSIKGAILRALINGYISKAWNVNLTPRLPLSYSILSYLFHSKKIYIDHGLLRSLPKGPAGSLLDIGCGNGEFLMYAKFLGWNVEGIDFDAKAIVSAKKNGINARLGGVELYSGESELFDVISLAHVIEHVHDPIELLKSSFKLLKKEGVFWIETPNINSIGSRMFGENWRGLEPPRHLCLFNHENLKSILLSVGFSSVEVAEYRPLFKNIYLASINLMFKHQSFFRKNYLEFFKIKKVEADCKSNYKNREYITYVCKK